MGKISKDDIPLKSEHQNHNNQRLEINSKLFSKYVEVSSNEILSEFKADQARGLEDKEAKIRLEQYGLNQLSLRAVSLWSVLARQFKSSFIYLLLAATIASFLVREYTNVVMILIFVFINVIIGFYQEYRSEKALKLLKGFIVAKAKVRRGGEEKLINTSDIVPGDIILLESGSVIPADLRFLKTHNLTIDESILTGESAPVKKNEISISATNNIYEAVNIGFGGSAVVGGKGEGVVFAIGKNTIFGAISKLTVETVRESGFEIGVRKLSRFILFLVMSTLALVLVANIFLKRGTLSVAELLIFAIALAISAVPEALPLVTTFSLSQGAMRMARNKVVVKRLSSIEDLGSIEVLCSDKTGTLTENKLKIADVYSKEIEKTIFYSAISSEILNLDREKIVNSFDLAILNRISDNDLAEVKNCKKINEIPFDPGRRRNSVLIGRDGGSELVIRGASEAIVNFCHNLSSENKKLLNKWIAEEGHDGRRVISVAKKIFSGADHYTIADEEIGFEFLGAISFIDPLKDSAKNAILKAKNLGVQVKILTGDSREVSGAVAYEVGLVQTKTDVITGEELEKLSVVEQHEAVLKHNVFARVSPEQKYKIIQLLQEKKEVGFLGEGINDAPALKVANVGIVVHGASDIAREASDIVLLKKSLEVIVDGIKEGREVFANTVKYIKATLSSNFGNFYAIAIASLFIDFLPMLPLQILLVNLLSDFPMIAMAADRVDEDELKKPRSYNIKDIALAGTILGLVSTVFDFIFFGIFVGFGAGVLQTNWFIASILTELAFIFSIRTKTLFFKSKPARILSILAIVAGAVTILIPMTHFGREFFKFTKPSMPHLLLIIGLVAVYFAISEIVKLIYYKFSNNYKPASIIKSL